MITITCYKSLYPGQTAYGCLQEGRTPYPAYPACTCPRDRGTRPSAEDDNDEHDHDDHDDHDDHYDDYDDHDDYLGEPSRWAWEKVKWQRCPIDAVRSKQNIRTLKIVMVRLIMMMFMIDDDGDDDVLLALWASHQNHERDHDEDEDNHH